MATQSGNLSDAYIKRYLFDSLQQLTGRPNQYIERLTAASTVNINNNKATNQVLAKLNLMNAELTKKRNEVKRKDS